MICFHGLPRVWKALMLHDYRFLLMDELALHDLGSACLPLVAMQGDGSRMEQKSVVY